jgi:hypothetical protein
MNKTCIFLFIILAIYGCSKGPVDPRYVNVTVRIPEKFPKELSEQRAHNESIGQPEAWGLSDPGTDINNYDCFGIFVRYPELPPLGNCTNSSGAQIINFDALAGTVERGQSITLNLLSGANRPIHLIGFKKSSGINCPNIFAPNFDSFQVDLSPPIQLFTQVSAIGGNTTSAQNITLVANASNRIVMEDCTHPALSNVNGNSSSGGSNYQSTVLADSPTNFYRLSETSGTLVNDYVGTLDGVLSGSYNLNVSTSPLGVVDQSGSGALGFDGTSAFLSLGNNFQFGSAQTFSIEFWAKWITSGSDQYFLSKGSDTAGLVVKVSPGGLITFILASSASNVLEVRTTNAITSNTWYHYVITYDGTQNASGLKIYINSGKQSTTNQSAGTFTSIGGSGDNFHVGKLSTSGTGHLQGAIDELAFYNTQLPTARIYKHYEVGRWNTNFNCSFIGTSNCQAWYDASATNSITSAANEISNWSDLSGNARHLTQASGPAKPSNQFGGISSAGTKNAVLFQSANSEFMSMSNAISMSDTKTVFVVFQPLLGVAQKILGAAGATERDYFGFNNSSYPILGFDVSDQVSTTILNNSSPVVVSYQTNNTANVKIAVNGNIETFAPGSPVVESAAYIVGGYNNNGINSDFFDGAIGEIIIYNSALTDFDQKIIASYLKAKWGIN